ncbi:lytic transglycosylase domain-containing protein [Ruminococcus sp. NK3A76]|uniref:lytic transglycosylase domain-containing protein n=1 Tax=Ruminococcus sp. NK3A76 TaxID=877411 RepID=UPI0009FBEFB3|nr:lytic transglycosylase domain-containing protein [Ruminococcus sp. NK3A76]
MAKKRKNGSAKSAMLAILAVCIAIAIFAGYVFYQKKGYIGPQEFTYPTSYEEYVLKYSREYNVEPEFIYAVIKTESGFDENAVSNVGARGLMQLMEDAYSWVKYRLDDKSEYNFDVMFDPETNIRYGTYYLSFLLEKYDGSIDLAAAAYHCGLGLVDSWIEQGTIDPQNFKVEQIPEENDQTSHYINKIRKAYDAYKIILKEENNNGEKGRKEQSKKAEG